MFATLHYLSQSARVCLQHQPGSSPCPRTLDSMHNYSTPTASNFSWEADESSPKIPWQQYRTFIPNALCLSCTTGKPTPGMWLNARPCLLSIAESLRLC